MIGREMIRRHQTLAAYYRREPVHDYASADAWALAECHGGPLDGESMPSPGDLLTRVRGVVMLYRHGDGTADFYLFAEEFTGDRYDWCGRMTCDEFNSLRRRAPMAYQRVPHVS